MNFFLFAGEASGDLLGEGLINALKKRLPEASFWGVGGPLMKEKGMRVIEPMEAFRMMGFREIVKGLFTIKRQFRLLTEAILKEMPDRVILIDYPGFNLRLAKKLRKAGYRGPIVQYVSPTVWVWRKGRIKTLERYVDLLLCIMPFEPALYKKMRAVYIGHPAAEKEREKIPGPPLLALFPGSRKSEICLNLPLELSLAKEFLKRYPEFQVGISCQDISYLPLIEEALKESKLNASIDTSNSLIERADLAIAKSGTVNLELALALVPSVVVYQVDGINRFIARYLLRLKLTFVSIVNILMNEEVFPEFVIRPFKEEDILEKLVALREGPFREKTLTRCRALKQLLSSKCASEEAANEILNLHL